MINEPVSVTAEPSQRGRSIFILLVAIGLGMAIFLLPDYAPDYAPWGGKSTVVANDSHATKVTRVPAQAATLIKTGEDIRSSIQRIENPALVTTATRLLSISTTETQTTEPLHQEQYLAELLAMLEGDGKDNALIHYALAFELAPGNPTAEQAALIKMVLEEGWDERAEPLLPYLLAWQAAFDKIHHGASLDYARGIGFDMGPQTPIPNFLKAQNSSKMLAVYSRYLESQGRGEDALKQLMTVMTMGRDFNSPDNFLISNLIGTAMGSVGLRQLNHLIQSNVLTPTQLELTLARLQTLGQSNASLQSTIDNEMQASLLGIRQLQTNPEAYKEWQGLNAAQTAGIQSMLGDIDKLETEHRKAWTEISEHFSKPYWERAGASQPQPNTDYVQVLGAFPNIAEAEARFLTVTSKMRQQQIEIAIRRYENAFDEPPRDIATLVSQNYLPAAPVDPFTGQGFTYSAYNGTYALYGSGPNIITPNDPAIPYTPSNGTFSNGVIRTR